MNVPVLKVAVVDDEPLARRTLTLLLAEQEGVEIVLDTGDPAVAAAELSRTVVDLLFLDVQMPGMDGFGVLRAVKGPLPAAVIFVTAFDTYALRAFEVHALDYLLKPFDDERFLSAFTRAREQLRHRRAADLALQMARLLGEGALPGGGAAPPSGGACVATPRYRGRFLIKSGATTTLVRASEIDWIAACDYYVELHVGGKALLLRESLRTLEQELDPGVFVRIHRGVMVNLDRIRSVEGGSADGEVILKDGTHLRVSRSYRDRLQEALRAG